MGLVLTYLDDFEKVQSPVLYDGVLGILYAIAITLMGVIAGAMVGGFLLAAALCSKKNRGVGIAAAITGGIGIGVAPAMVALLDNLHLSMLKYTLEEYRSDLTSIIFIVIFSLLITTSIALSLCYMMMNFKNKAGGLCVFAFILTLIRYFFVPAYQSGISYLLHSVIKEGALLTALLAVGQFFQLAAFFFLAVISAIFVFISAVVEKCSGFEKKEKAPKEKKEKAPKVKKEKTKKVVEESIEATTEETEEPVEEAVEESIEEPAEEPVEEAVEETAEETADEETVEVEAPKKKAKKDKKKKK